MKESEERATKEKKKYIVKSSVREERKKREGELAVIRSLVIIGARVLLLLAYSTSRKESASKVHTL